jgi:hypothetical protein
MLIVDVIVGIVDCYVRTSEAIVSLYDLDVEHLCTFSENTRKHRIKLFLFNVDLLTDAKEDLNLII